jgi:outer membrane receptor protein involved in Fe transport
MADGGAAWAPPRQKCAMPRFLRPLLLLLLLSVAARAQEDIRTGVTAYPAAWFQANQPGTALDMVRLLPGFQLQDGDSSLRGFAGTMANILIDGALPASKEEGAETILQRISAAAVLRIELIRPAAGIDMHGYPLIANIVRGRAAALSGHVEMEDAFNHYGFSAPRAALHLTWQGARDTLDLSASYGREWNGNHGFGRRDRFAPDGTVLRLADYAQPELQTTAELSAQYRRNILGGQIDMSGVIHQEVEYSDIAERVTFPAPSLENGRDRSRERSLEGQLHYQHPLPGTGRWELFLSHRAGNDDGFSRSGDGGGVDISQSRRGRHETVLRGDARATRGAWSLEAGAEGAINILRSRNMLAQDGVAVPLPSDTIRVEEQRAEFFADATWHAAPALTLEPGIHYETSRIGQRGDVQSTRALSFLKPRLLASWRPATGTELRFLVERRVGQLDFDAFASSASLNSGTVSAGNRDLLPERTLRLELTWEQHFWDRAALTLTARRDLIDGAIDHLAIVTAAGVFDATGNIGNGRRDELEASLRLPLDRLALSGVTLRFDGTLRHSRVTDPVTGRPRRISGSTPLSGRIELTHDLNALNLRWGVSFELPEQETDYRIDEIDGRHHVSHLDAFVEYRPLPAWTVKLFAQDLAQSPYVRDRLLYDGLRGWAPLAAEERRALNNGALLGLNVRYDFGL